MYDPRDQCNSGVVQAQAFCETLMLHGLNDRGLQSGREFDDGRNFIYRGD